MSVEVPIHDRLGKSATGWNFIGKVDYVDEWFLMSNPAPLVLILVGYLLFVLKLGPDYMKNRPAFKLGNVLIVYNIIQVVFSCYLAYIGTSVILPNGLISTNCLMEKESDRYNITSAGYAYMVAKLSELLDTAFFVLKKNNRQITFLHVYHHFIMLTFTWFILKYEPSYNIMFLGTLNSYVHIVMYMYYFLSSFPSLAKYLWWKKYITKLQIAQFVLIVLQAIVNYRVSGCPMSYILMTTIIFNGLLFTGLFTKFYFESYKSTKKVE